MSDYLIHYGIKGMKWGVRRYQNADGTLTNAGKKHDKQNREKISSSTKKKIIVGALAVATVATAAVLYSRNREAVDSAVRKTIFNFQMANSIRKDTKPSNKGIKNFIDNTKNAREQARKDYVSANKNKILKSTSQAIKYKNYLTQDEANEAQRWSATMNALHANRIKEIRRGADYVNSVLSYANAASTVYNLAKSPLAKDLLNKNKQDEKIEGFN